MSYDFTDSRPIPRCDDCKSPLGDLGFCEECAGRAEEPTPEQQAQRDAEADDQPLYDRTFYVDPPLHTITCICGRPALIIEPHGTFCGACWEAQDVWVLWKNDAATFVWMLRQQRARLNELAERLATYLSRKTGMSLSMDSVLAMWRPLLDDGEPPPAAMAVVPYQQLVA